MLNEICRSCFKCHDTKAINIRCIEYANDNAWFVKEVIKKGECDLLVSWVSVTGKPSPVYRQD